MAARNTPVAEGHLPKLQSSIELHKPGIEPKPTRLEKPKPNKANEFQIHVLSTRKLEKTLDHYLVDLNHDRFISMEILSIQTKGRIRSHGVLCSHS